MDPVSSNPYQHVDAMLRSQNAPKASKAPMNDAITQLAAAPAGKQSDYASLFEDDALFKLQSNLESIAQMAEQTLKGVQH